MPKSLSVKNIPNLCRKLAHRYMQAFYTDWVYKVFWHFLKMYPICVECLHIGICKHSTQIGYIRLTPIPFLHKLGTFSKMCPICVECLRIIIILYTTMYIMNFQDNKKTVELVWQFVHAIWGFLLSKLGPFKLVESKGSQLIISPMDVQISE